MEHSEVCLILTETEGYWKEQRNCMIFRRGRVFPSDFFVCPKQCFVYDPLSVCDILEKTYIIIF